MYYYIILFQVIYKKKVDKDKYENVTLKNYNLFLEKYNINPKDKKKTV